MVVCEDDLEEERYLLIAAVADVREGSLKLRELRVAGQREQLARVRQ
jgi:hypothetical protein